MNERGSAALEIWPVFATLVLFTMGLLTGVYLIFARAWIQYQSEQALYCLSEAKPVVLCRRSLEKKLTGALPWGQVGPLSLHSSTVGKNEQWKVDVEWKFQRVSLKIAKELDARRLLQSRALRW